MPTFTLLAPVFLFFRRRLELYGLDLHDLELNAALGALDDLAWP